MGFHPQTKKERYPAQLKTYPLDAEKRPVSFLKARDTGATLIVKHGPILFERGQCVKSVILSTKNIKLTVTRNHSNWQSGITAHVVALVDNVI